MSYQAVMQVALERPNLLPLVAAAYRLHQLEGNHFTGSSVLTAAPGLTSNLLPLTRYGILHKTGQQARRHGAYYQLNDPPGVERALQHLASLQTIPVDLLSRFRRIDGARR